jgi:hypothetical protein
MHSALTETFARLDRSRAGLQDAVNAVPHALRDQALGSGRWSIAGVVEHIALLDERFTGIISTRIAEARATDPGQELEELEEPALLPPNIETMLADRTERRQAPEPLHPTGMAYEAAWERAEAMRTAFRDLLSSANGVPLSRVIHQHPRFGELSAYQWAGFLAAHEARHAEQIREIATQLDAER